MNLTNHLEGDAHPGWKGAYASYSAIHFWIRRHKPKPGACEHCQAQDRPLDWANVSGEYKRVLDDWIALCKPCHRSYDRKDACPAGHARIDRNTFVDRRGIRKCRVCKNEAWRRRYYERQGRMVPA